MANQKLFFFTNLSFLLSKAIVFCPLLPIRTTLNLLFAKNAAVLLLFALILCCKARTSHRFKSLPAIPGEVAAFRKTGYLMIAGCFNNNHTSTGDLNRPRESRGSQPSISLKHGRLAHVRSQFSLFRRSPTHKNLPLATFCTSERVFAVLFARRKKYQSVSLTGKLRGFPNLDSARRNGGFAQTKLKPFETFRGFANLESVRHKSGFTVIYPIHLLLL